ncbi:hypothetical protein HYPSUDRAFT_53478 [Hypholoma sublateritium FD-334 SS-4]|uniref:Uncharacterized protein n=1 Tax=Hypholoma sublateritium (strain FD-334 SS-4) TaxID=945553 RepID=A0A0D2LCI0_HYPSF|nr:hypothetical protein HYPSUDRAFT_53478 [Hypholoma sublateritium FD-334 SS-4]
MRDMLLVKTVLMRKRSTWSTGSKNVGSRVLGEWTGRGSRQRLPMRRYKSKEIFAAYPDRVGILLRGTIQRTEDEAAVLALTVPVLLPPRNVWMTMDVASESQAMWPGSDNVRRTVDGIGGRTESLPEVGAVEGHKGAWLPFMK